MVLVHGGGPGVEKIAASWADRNGVNQIVCKPDWDVRVDVGDERKVLVILDDPRPS